MTCSHKVYLSARPSGFGDSTHIVIIGTIQIPRMDEVHVGIGDHACVAFRISLVPEETIHLTAGDWVLDSEEASRA